MELKRSVWGYRIASLIKEYRFYTSLPRKNIGRTRKCIY